MIEGRVGQAVMQKAVVGEQQQPRGAAVETPHRNQALSHARRHEVEHGGGEADQRVDGGRGPIGDTEAKVGQAVGVAVGGEGGFEQRGEGGQVGGHDDDVAGLEVFARTVTDALADRVALLKPQLAFFERHGSRGLAVLEQVVVEARAAGALVLADAGLDALPYHAGLPAEVRAAHQRRFLSEDGVVIVDAETDHSALTRPPGPIGFKGHHEYVEFRNLRIKELP